MVTILYCLSGCPSKLQAKEYKCHLLSQNVRLPSVSTETSIINLYTFFFIWWSKACLSMYGNLILTATFSVQCRSLREGVVFHQNVLMNDLALAKHCLINKSV